MPTDGNELEDTKSGERQLNGGVLKPLKGKRDIVLQVSSLPEGERGLVLDVWKVPKAQQS